MVKNIHLLTVNNFINGKEYSLTVPYKDDIAVYTRNHASLNFPEMYIAIKTE